MDQYHAATDPVMVQVGAITPRAYTGASSGRRLNLVLPFISAAHVFGGAATALRMFDRLRKSFPHARIVVMDEVTPHLKTGEFYSEWPILDSLAPDSDQNHIVGLGKWRERSLAVRPGDVFVATIWYSAHTVFPLLDWQDTRYGRSVGRDRKLIYLIQDYEPGFYAWSTRYAMADATYLHPERTIAVFNTAILATFFEAQGYSFVSRQVLEPRLNPELALMRSRMTQFEKKRAVLIYGRPSIERNAFPIILMALRQWAGEFGRDTEWELISAGEEFSDIDLGFGCKLRSLGKAPLQDYAQLLSRSAIGVSLMISPHPSYPPLEMAAFGVRVLTNRYANKDLSSLSPSIRSIDRCDADCLAQALIEECRAFDARLAKSGITALAVPPDEIEWHGCFLDRGDELAGVEDLVSMGLSTPT